MAENTPYTELKAAIASLEKEQALKREMLKEEFKATYDSLTPFNFIKRSLSKLTESPEIRNNLFTIVLPLLTGILSKKAFAGSRRNTVLKQAGIVLIDGLNRYISQNPEVLNKIGHLFIGLFRKKRTEGKTEDQDSE